MITAAIIIGIILLLVVFFISLNMSIKIGDDFDKGMVMGILMIIILFVESNIINCILVPSQPTAMDVYQNKTTLEYKVVDDVKVDSVVIFKEEFKK